MRADLWELGPACNVFFFGTSIHHHRTWNTVVIQGIFGRLDDRRSNSVPGRGDSTLVGHDASEPHWFSQGSVFPWGSIIFRSMDGTDHYIVIVLFTVKTRPLCHDRFKCVYSLDGFKILCISELWDTPLGSNGANVSTRSVHLLEVLVASEEWDLLTSVHAEGLLRAERINRREALRTAGEIWRTSEKLHFEQSFGYKEKELGGDLEGGRNTKRQQQDW